ncbi:MAG TPA: GIY-YIG nuclease family protein [Chlamydiales bacterium]|nr:GIY-YIG nuclease family protein [Chlamydiales bacterium]
MAVNLDTFPKTPEKTYPLQADSAGWVTLQLTPGAKEAARVIYMFREISTGKVLIGKTEAKVESRVPAYLTAINHPEKDKGKMPLPKAVRENPNGFEFGILCKAPETVDLSALEDAYVAYKKAITDGFNKNKGGGGGHARKKLSVAEKENLVPKNLLADFQSPEKKPIAETKRGYKVQLTPRSKTAKKLIYVFKNNMTGERYVGQTVRQLGKRMSEHMHYAKHDEKDAGKAPLYEAIREDHTQFGVGVLYRAEEATPEGLDAIERAFIRHYNSVEEGYNQK